MKLKLFYTVILTFLCIVIAGCSSPSGPNQPKSEISLSLIDVSVNLSYIRVSVHSPITSGEVIKVFRNGSPVFSFQALKDTILTDTSLTQNTSYTYSAAIYKDERQLAISGDLNVKTSSTTSGNVSWQVFKFGIWGSVIRDILIINDDDIWAVGHIYKSFEDQTEYNALHWDGQKWTICAIPIRLDYGQTQYTAPVELYSIFRTQDNYLCVTGSGGGLSIYDGTKWNCIDDPFGTPKPSDARIWGTTKDNLYFANATGTITHYDGRKFEFLETGNKIYLTDIYGTTDGKEIWACGFDIVTLESVLLRINGNKVEKLYEYTPNKRDPLFDQNVVSSLWCTDKGFFALSGGGYDYYTQSYLNRNVSTHTKVTNGTGPYRLRGTGLNDLFAVGDDAVVWHFDGLKWTDDRSQQILYSMLLGLDVKEHTIVTGGSGPNGAYAFIMLGRR